MDSKFTQQLKKGVLEMLVLSALEAKPSYGYELRTRLAASSHGLLALKEGTMYPILYRLEDTGLISSSWDCVSEGRSTPKKNYDVTQSGKETLNAKRSDWAQFYTCINAILEEGKA